MLRGTEKKLLKDDRKKEKLFEFAVRSFASQLLFKAARFQNLFRSTKQRLGNNPQRIQYHSNMKQSNIPVNTQSSSSLTLNNALSQSRVLSEPSGPHRPSHLHERLHVVGLDRVNGNIAFLHGILTDALALINESTEEGDFDPSQRQNDFTRPPAPQ